MTFNELWAQLVRKQPKLESGESAVTFTAANLKHLLQQVYSQGQTNAKQQSDGNPFMDMFNLN